MKVFKFNEIVFSIVGILPSDRFEKPFGETVKTFSFYFHLIGVGVYGTACCAYIFGHLTDFSQLADTMMSFVGMFAALANIGSYISVAMNVKNVKKLSNELQKIFDNGTIDYFFHYLMV